MKKMSKTQDRNGQIKPGDYASWIHIVHNQNDKGIRYENWWWHNQLFDIKQENNDVNVAFEIANRGWADASFLMIDYFFPTSVGISHVRDESFSLLSGEQKSVYTQFTIDGYLPNDSSSLSAQVPNIVIRVTDLSTPAPSPTVIIACLEGIKNNNPDSLKTLFNWKRVPGLFVYPCCALFLGKPDQ